MPIATGTKCLIDCEDDLTDSSGLGNNGTLVGPSAYQTAGAWHGNKAFSSSGGGRFTLPTGVLATAGTMEASFRSPAAMGNSKVLWSCNCASGTRAIEIYHYLGTIYAYGNGVGGTNTGVLAVSTNKNYYIKDTWDGAGNRRIWAGEWTVAGTVTLSKVFDSTGCSTATPSAVYMLDNAIGNKSDWAVDWVRFRNVHDNTSTVTVDPSTGSAWPAHMMRRRRR